MKRVVPVVAAVIIRSNGLKEVLLHWRAGEDGDAPEAEQMWECPGGTIQYGEDPEQALYREAREELGGAQLTVSRLLHAQSNIYSNRKHYLVLYYECYIWPQFAPDGCQWFRLDDVINQPTLPGTREAIIAYLDG